MKKIALAAAALASFAATAAHAQSSVTIYGALDDSIAYFSHQKGADGKSGGTWQLSPGNLSPNLWGLKGTEDLGSGLSAIFKIESGFNVNTGASGQGDRLFGRQAYVGLDSNQGGTFTLGRQYDPLIDLIQPLTNDGAFGPTFATPGDMDNYDNSYRTNNSVKYTSPNFAGLQIGAMYAFGGVPGSTGAGQTIAVAAAYNHGPLGLGAGYFRANNAGGNSTFDTFNSGAGVSGAQFDSQAITGGFRGANSQQIIRAAGDYVFGPVTFGIAYSNVEYANYGFTNSTGANVQGTSRFNTGQAFLNYQVTPAAILGVGYDYTKGYGNGVNAAYSQVSLGGDYFLSKRTDVYVLAGYQHASGNTVAYNSTSGLTTLTTATASMGDFGNDAVGNNQTMAMVGIRHKF
ncbi:porin [Paraburkholderia sp. B3]|uniref:porin n=1 Tax=Paraburkholderia sp. B3 TaxID=3134791 RepID=UPI003981A03D